MRSSIGNLKYVFVALIFVISAGLTAYEWLYVIPAHKCDAAHDWWSAHARKCYEPIYLPSITGRKPGEKVIDWHEKARPAQP